MSWGQHGAVIHGWLLHMEAFGTLCKILPPFGLSQMGMVSSEGCNNCNEPSTGLSNVTVYCNAKKTGLGHQKHHTGLEI